MTDAKDAQGPEPIGDILRSLLQRKETEVVAPLQELRAAWKRAAAARDVTGTRVSFYSRGSVVIEVESPPMLAELAQFRRAEMIKALRDQLEAGPRVTELRFRLGTFAVDESKPSTRPSR